MKKRLLASLLILCMVLTLLPATALATEELPEGETPVVCTKTKDCTAETHDEECPLYVASATDPEPEPPMEQGSEPESTEPMTAELLQKRIDALPDVELLEDMTGDEQSEIYEEVESIYAALLDFTDGTDALDTAKLDNAAEWFNRETMMLGEETGLSGTPNTNWYTDEVKIEKEYIITTPDELAGLIYLSNNDVDQHTTNTAFNGWVFKLGNNIDMSVYSGSYAENDDGSHTFVPTENYKKLTGGGGIYYSNFTLDGQGYSIENYVFSSTNYNSTTDRAAFITTMSATGTVKNITFSNCAMVAKGTVYESSNSYMNAMVVGQSRGTVEDVAVENCLIVGTSDNTGGIVARNSGTMSRCTISNSTVIGRARTAGICGYALADELSKDILIEQCAANDVAVYGYGSNGVGGIVGQISDVRSGTQSITVDKCFFNGRIYNDHTTGGMIVGSIIKNQEASSLSISNCTSCGTISVGNAPISPFGPIFGENTGGVVMGCTGIYAEEGMCTITPSSDTAFQIMAANGYVLLAPEAGSVNNGTYLAATDGTSATLTLGNGNGNNALALCLAVASSGTCGDPSVNDGKNVTWALTQNNTDNENPTYTLTISGEGATSDYASTDTATRPWHGYANGITKVVIEDGVTYLGQRTCLGLAITEIDWPTKEINVGVAAFGRCTELTSLDIPANVIFLGMGEVNQAWTFSGCSGLKTVKTATNIMTQQFGGCTSLRSIEVLSGVTDIAYYAFAGCTSLKNISLPDGLRSFGAFSSSPAIDLTGYTIELPSTVTSLGHYSFDGVTIGGISIPASLVTFGSCSLNTANSDCVFYLESLDSYKGMRIGYGGGNAVYKEQIIAYTNGGTFPAGAIHVAGALSTPQKEGYAFAGWYADNSFQTEADSVTAKQTYYAKWVSKITFDANGGIGGMTTQEITEGTSANLSVNSFTRTGYTFSGWNTAANGTGTGYTDSQSITPTGNTTLYAHWTPNSYTISFSGGTGTTGSTAQVNATYDTLTALTVNGFTKSGFNFTGWDTDSRADKVVYADKAQVKNLTAAANGSVTLYAVWTEKTVLNPDVTAQTKTYNGAEQTFTLDGYTITYQQDGRIATPKDAGTYDVVISAEETDATAAYKNTIYDGLVITPAALTITANNQSIYVGGMLPAEYTYTVTGLAGEEALTTEPIVACATANASNAGTYPITASGAVAGKNYTITYVNGTLTVAAKDSTPLTITASSTALTGGGSVKLTVTGIPSGGTATVTQIDNQGGEAKTLDLTGNGDISVNLDNKDAKYTFTVSYAGDGGHAAATATCEVSVTRRNSSGGGSGSSGGSTTGGVSGSGDSVSVSTDGGTVSSSQMDAAVGKANEGATIEIKATGSTAATLPVSGMKDAAKNDNDVTVATKNGEVTLSAAAIEGLVEGASSGQTVKVSVTTAMASTAGLDAGTPVFDVSVSVGNAAVHSFDGALTITLTVSGLSKIEHPYVMHILNDGTKQYLKPAISGSKLTVTGVRGLSYFAVIPGSEVPEELPFTDVAESAYYYDAVRWAYENDITGGTSDTTFSPDAACTRAQAVTFLWRAAGSPAATGGNPFTDVDSGAYYYDAVLWAVEKGVTGGTSATTFSPDATCTRGQIVTFLYRYAGSPAVTAGAAFTDVASDAYYADAVAWAAAENITGGTSTTTFAPDADCTRGQIVTFLYRHMGK